VAQIARRLAAKLKRSKFGRKVGTIDPEVVEAAALAHDLGHPPFGHIAEQELDRLVQLYGSAEGYEGNAQSFRILTRLAAHATGDPGLNLTRATLNAVLKYPWPRDLSNPNGKKHKKYGYYQTEEDYFLFARRGYTDDRQSPEAAIMDVADGIAYSVHDLDDFFRAGLVPLSLLRFSASEFESFLQAWKTDPKSDISAADISAREADFRSLLQFWPTEDQYTGKYEQREILRWTTSKLINRFVKSVRLTLPDAEGHTVHIARNAEVEMAFLQRLVKRYVINNPRLATQQAGQRRVVRTLFAMYFQAIRKGDSKIVPPAFSKTIADIRDIKVRKERNDAEARAAADIVASFSDGQANVLFRRLSGITPGSVSDLLEG
jgi:dGTPase